MFPAAAPHLHLHAALVIDEDAASALRLAGNFQEARAAKPKWHGL